MLRNNQEVHKYNSMKIGLIHKLDLNKLEKPFLDACMSQISSKSVQHFERKSKMYLTKIVY